MKILTFFAFAFGVISMATSLTTNQVTRMLEMNSLFDVLHKNYDNQIRNQWMIQKHNMNVYNAQFLSRYGFVVDQVKTRELEIREAIQRRGQEIGNPNAQCLENAIYTLDGAIDYAVVNFKNINSDIINHFNRISGSFFYPLIEVLHYQSNSIQWEVLNVIGRYNPVTQMTQFINRLEEDYYITVLLYELALGNMQSELRLYSTQMNQVKAEIFPMFNNVLNYYMHTTNSILNYLLPNCSA